jgi:hypothetical protein
MAKALGFLILTLFITLNAGALPLGSYRTTDAYCTNPDYVYSKEEQDYIDTLKGKGACADGKYTSSPCFEDYYVFGTPSAGQFITLVKDIPGVECITTTQLTLAEKTPGILELTFGKSESKSHSSKDGVEISCGDNGQEMTVSYNYKQENGNVLLMSPADPKCGSYVFKLSPVAEVPK